MSSAAPPGPPPLLPAEDELDLLHTRQYEARTYRLDDDHMMLRGAIMDRKPPGLYVPDDDQELIMHHMRVDLTINIRTMTIIDAAVDFLTHPMDDCPNITRHYRELVGLNVARGFNRKVRELFGGPRGCAHTTAMMQAIGPAVFQSMWSLRILSARTSGETDPAAAGDIRPDRAIEGNLNTCHIWDEDGEHVSLIRKGESTRRAPLSVEKRLAELGREDEDWFRF